MYGGLGSGSWSLVLWVMGLVKGRVGYIHISLLLNHVLLLCSIGLGNGNEWDWKNGVLSCHIIFV